MELTLTPDMLLVLGLVGFAIVMFILEWVRADVVALLVLVVIGITGLMTVDKLFDGFASNAVLSLIGIMIMGAGLDRTGVLNRAAAFILRLSGGVESRVSLFLNTTTGVLLFTACKSSLSQSICVCPSFPIPSSCATLFRPTKCTPL